MLRPHLALACTQTGLNVSFTANSNKLYMGRYASRSGNVLGKTALYYCAVKQVQAATTTAATVFCVQMRDTAVPGRQDLHGSMLTLGGQGCASEAAPKQGCHKQQAGRPQALEG